jgi:SAM-dependent methyltransferase
VADSLPLTGERTAPGVPSENYWFQRHVAAYRFAASTAEGTVVDAGCGEGYGTEIITRQARGAVGLDLDEPTLIHASRRYGALRFLRCDLTSLPLAPSSVDSIVALQVIEHLESADVFIAGSSRALRPGGVLILSTPNRATFPAGLNPFHTKEYEAAELRDLLTQHFPNVRLLGVAHRGPLRWVERLLGEPIQDRLVRSPYPELPAALRAALRAVTPHSFRVTTHPTTALDLIAVCRTIQR